MTEQETCQPWTVDALMEQFGVEERVLLQRKWRLLDRHLTTTSLCSVMDKEMNLGRVLLIGHAPTDGSPSFTTIGDYQFKANANE